MLRHLALLGAVAFLVLTVVNASWLAPDPKGAPKLIAHHGLAQQFNGIGPDGCIAAHIEAPYHDYLENTVDGIARAFKLGAHVVEVDIAPTVDGEIALFHDLALDCRTDGKGPVRDASLAQLKALDAGYGYSADGGKTHPFRGKGVGAIPALEELTSILPSRSRIMFDLKSNDPHEAELLARKLAEAGRDPVASRDAFFGQSKPVARIRELYPEAWAWTALEAEQCSRDYVLLGWSGYLPQSCRGKTMVIPINAQFAFWGWPNRLIARMEANGGQVIVTGPYESSETNIGLTLPEQLGEIPSTFNGYVWVEDAFSIVPALIARFDDRSQEEIDASQVALERRRGDASQ